MNENKDSLSAYNHDFQLHLQQFKWDDYSPEEGVRVEKT